MTDMLTVTIVFDNATYFCDIDPSSSHSSVERSLVESLNLPRDANYKLVMNNSFSLQEDSELELIRIPHGRNIQAQKSIHMPHSLQESEKSSIQQKDTHMPYPSQKFEKSPMQRDPI